MGQGERPSGEEEREEGGWPVAMCEALNLIALGLKNPQQAELHLSNFPHSSLETAQRF